MLFSYEELFLEKDFFYKFLNILHFSYTKSEEGTFPLELKCSQGSSHWNNYSGKNNRITGFGVLFQVAVAAWNSYLILIPLLPSHN